MSVPSFDEEKQIQQLISIYRKAYQDILQQIIEKEAKGQWSAYYRGILEDIQRILAGLDAEAQEWIADTLDQVYRNSRDQVIQGLIHSGYPLPTDPEFSQIHRRAINVLAQNMVESLRSAHQFVGRRSKDVFRQVGIEAATQKLATGTTVKDMKQKVISRLIDKGLTGFQDKLKRNWRLDTYAEMVARTTTREAASVAVLNQCLEFGIDLVQVSKHYPTCEICAPKQGKVYSISGKDKRYPKLTDDLRPPFHPNCRHVLMAYLRQYDKDAEGTERYSKQSLTNDPRSKAEKEAYKEIRDQVTIKTNRRRAREILYNKGSPLADRIIAAKKLYKTYIQTDTKAVGKDSKLLKQYSDYLKCISRANPATGKTSFYGSVYFNNKTGKVTFTGPSLPVNAIAYGVLDLEGRNGKIVTRRYYDNKGIAELDIHFTDHNNRKHHPVVPHAHDWSDKDICSWRALSALEKHKIKDLLGGDENGQ